jgi:pyroglutamyl-peptidase
MLNLMAARPPEIKSSLRRGHEPARILVTGFGPFPGMPFNASGALVRALGETPPRRIPGPRLITSVLPTDWRLALQQMRGIIAGARPHVLVHFGVSARARGFAIETRAVNETCMRADCAGCPPPGRAVRRNVPAILPATLPAARLVQRLRMAGVPAQLSDDAGRYLCNAVMFESLWLAEAGRIAAAGFIHIPALGPPGEEPAADSGFSWETLRRGAAIILDTLASPVTAVPRAVRAGPASL